MEIRLAGTIENSLVNGEGIRKVIFGQGCLHNCKGCFNTHTHALDQGNLVDIDYLINDINRDLYIDGVTFSGGDPFEQALTFSKIAEGIDKSIWCYTGYTFEYIMENIDKREGWRNLIQNIDVLVDGKFIESLKSNNFKYRGSLNQRIIDVKKSIEENSAIYYSFKNEHEMKKEYIREFISFYSINIQKSYDIIKEKKLKFFTNSYDDILYKIQNIKIPNHIKINWYGMKVFVKRHIDLTKYFIKTNIEVEDYTKFNNLLSLYNADIDSMIEILNRKEC